MKNQYSVSGVENATSFFNKVEVRTRIAYVVEMQEAKWNYVLAYALGWWLMPFMVIASKALNRRIEFGKFLE
jgi:hypothetical protein